MSKKFMVYGLLFMVGAAILWMVINRQGGIQSPGVQVNQVRSTPSPTPSPTPLPVNRNTNLDEALKSLTPKDYSSEYPNLTE